MTIRAKLTLFFSVMLILFIAVGGASVWTVQLWRKDADRLSSTRTQSLRAERVRAGTDSRVFYALEYLEGEKLFDEEFDQIGKRVQASLDTLLTAAATSEERDHIDGLRETESELEWLLNNVLAGITSGSLPNPVESRSRLREAATNVADGIAILEQYYRSQGDRAVKSAGRAELYQRFVIGVSIFIALGQLLALSYLVKRWLVEPIGAVGEATRLISRGNFETRVTTSFNDEWNSLANSINNMAKSLRTLQQQLLSHERVVALGEIASFTAHNIRNPLAGIRAAAQVTHKSLPEKMEEERQTMVDIVSATDRLNAWISRFMEFAAPVNIMTVQTDLNELVRQTILLVHSGQAAGNAAITMDLDDSLPEIPVDAVLIEQALSALITNGIESGGDNVVVSTRLERSEDGQNFVTIRIVDNGRGISKQVRERLFQAFVTDKPDGTGLGLAQSKKILSLHGGELSLENTSEKGTDFLVKLPQRGDGS